MIISPPKRKFKPKPIALVLPGYRTLTVETIEGVSDYRGGQSCYRALVALEGHAIYVRNGLTGLRHTTGARVWQASTWRHRSTAMTLDGTKVKVHSLRGTLDQCPDPFGELLRFAGWLALHGVTPGGVSSMGWNLWRSTLQRDITLATSPRVGLPACYGGRQQARLKRDTKGNITPYQHQASVDIVGAYPHAMASRPYATGLRKVSSTTEIDPTVPGIVEATVHVDPALPHGPLPERIADDMIHFRTGPGIHGTWAWCELAAALSLEGVTARVDKVWAPTTTTDLFTPEWTALVMEGRALGGGAAKLAKGCVNATWGMFGMRGDNRGTLRWSDEHGLEAVSVEAPATRLPHAATSHIAAETAARVRGRMLTEGIYGPWGWPIHVDTDGAIFRASMVREVPTEGALGEWVVKTYMRDIEIRAAQIYRHRPRRHALWQYVTAGVPPSMARDIFERVGRHGSPFSLQGLDTTLPGYYTADKEKTWAAAREARLALGALDA